MRLSVIVPVFNGASTIRLCLGALVSQAGWRLGTDYEVIVVDDGSTDETVRIVREFPVRLISLGENRGRITARETGARAAVGAMLLLIDSRVVAAPDLLAAQEGIAGEFLMVGELGESRRAAEDPVDRVFLLLRNKYYAGGYPQRDDVLEIGPRNFWRSPKGLTCARIPKDLFLSIQPEDKGKHVNDDARLLSTLVFEKGIVLRRCRAMRVEYHQRREARAIRPWILHRGVMFVDFVLKKSAVLKACVFGTMMVTLALPLLAFLAPAVAAVILASCALAFFALCLWLSDRPRDVVVLLTVLPTLLLFFGVGVGKGLWLRGRARVPNGH